MKYKFTKVEDSEQPALRDALSLLTHGTDTKGEFVKVSDALSMPNAGSIFKRAIEEIILAPIQPNLVGSRLVRTTFMENVGRTVSVRTLGAVDRFDFSVAEEGEYPEISAATGNGSMVELRFAKYGCKFKISEELLEYSTWDLISYQIQQVAAAMARFRDGEIFKMIFGRGLVVFDNLNPSASVVGRTGGRDITGAGNGSMTNEDLIDMYAAIVANGYTPKVIVCHPLHWAMFAKDPILRESGIMKGDISQWLNSTLNTFNPYSKLPSAADGARADVSQDVATLLDDQSKPQIPNYNPISGLTVITSPLVPFDPIARTGDIVMLDPDNSGILAISEPLNLDEWDEKRNDIKVIKFREKWALEVVDSGKAIAVARNVSFSPNELFVNPQIVMDNVVPIKRKD